MTTAFACMRDACRALRAHQLRSLLAMLGIVVGAAALILVVALATGAQHDVDAQLQALGTNLLIIGPGSSTAVGVRRGAGSRLTLTEDDAGAIRNDLLDVHASAPMIIDMDQVIAGSANWYTRLYGTTPDYLDVVNWPVASGKAFEAADVMAAAKVVLLGETVAQKLFGGADPVGQIVRVRQAPMRVVGVLARKGQNQHGVDRDDGVFLPISTLRRRLYGGSLAKLNVVESVLVKLDDSADADVRKEDVRALLRDRHRLQGGFADDFTISDLAEFIAARQDAARTLKVLLCGVAAVAMLVGGIGIMNVMLVATTERTREIGLRLAVGARARDILWQFLVEALVLSAGGALVGAIVGIVAAYAVQQLGPWHAVLGVHAVVLAVTFAATTGVLFGLYPARKASRLRPADALRYE